jgi:hypothetical protein
LKPLLILYVLDALLLQQGAITWLVGWFPMVLGAVDLFRGRTRRGLSTLVAYALLDCAIFATIFANQALANSRADGIITAVEQYRSHQGPYPERLEELVPLYLPSVPLARYALPPFNRFHYHRYDYDNASLSYDVLPPFGRLVYNFSTKTWRLID